MGRKKIQTEGLNLIKNPYPQFMVDMGDHYTLDSPSFTHLLSYLIFRNVTNDIEISNPRESSTPVNIIYDLDFYTTDLDITEIGAKLVRDILPKTIKSLQGVIDWKIIYNETVDDFNHSFILDLYFNKDVVVKLEVEQEPILEYKTPLLHYAFKHKTHLKEQLLTKYKINPTVVKTLFKQKPVELTESLLNVLDQKILKSLIKEGPSFKCSINDVEKRAKSIIFVKYNWDPKNTVFTTEDDAVQIVAIDDLKPELQQVTNDQVLFKFLETLSKSYTKDLNKEFSNFCSKIKFLSSLSTDVISSVYCYTIIQQGDQLFFFSSNGEKKKLKRANNPQYLPNKLYFKIGLFASNVKTEGLNITLKHE